MTKLSGTIPGDDTNGLHHITRQLTSKPHDVHVAIVLLDCCKITTDTDSGAVEPTARVRRVEVVPAQHVGLVHDVLMQAYETRTGKAQLPLGYDEEVRLAFGEDVHPRPEPEKRGR